METMSEGATAGRLSYEGPAWLVAADGTLTEGRASIQMAAHPTMFGADVTLDATVEVDGPVPAGLIMATKALRVEGGEDFPVEVGEVAVRQRGEFLRVTLRGSRYGLSP
jgi:hypothetical protein